MRHAFVVPRYGAEVRGGAELGARMLAEHLVADLGWQVEVFTTCALDARTWADHYPAGTTFERGVTVHRFASRSGRAPDFDERSTALLGAPWAASAADQDEWFRLQGPVCPDAVDAAVRSPAPCVAGYPYLYLPVVEAVRALGPRAILHPAAHDEPPLHLSRFDEVFGRAGGLVLHTEAEADLVARRFPATAATPQIVLGLGVAEPPSTSADAARGALGLGDRPFLVSVGRVDRQKGSGLLADYFCAYKRRRPGPLALVLLGQVVDPPPEHSDLVVPGLVDDGLKWSALVGADALVSPSPNESFSLVLLEAWMAGIPVVVNAACAATMEHVAASGGGVGFRGYGEFEVIVDRLTGVGAIRAALAGRGRRYVQERFRWPVLVRRYAAFVERRARAVASATTSSAT